MELGRWTVIILHRIAGPQDFGIFKATHTADEFVLDLVGKTRRNAVDIDLIGVATFRLQKKLVLILLGKFDDFIFNARTVAGSDPFDDARVKWGFVQVRANDFVRGFVGVGDPATNLAGVE